MGPVAQRLCPNQHLQSPRHLPTLPLCLQLPACAQSPLSQAGHPAGPSLSGGIGNLYLLAPLGQARKKNRGKFTFQKIYKMVILFYGYRK